MSEFKKLAELNPSDLSNLKMLRSVINMGDFSVKGDAMIRVADLFKWLDDLENKIIGELKLKAVKTPPKIKKLGK